MRGSASIPPCPIGTSGAKSCRVSIPYANRMRVLLQVCYARANSAYDVCLVCVGGHTAGWKVSVKPRSCVYMSFAKLVHCKGNMGCRGSACGVIVQLEVLSCEDAKGHCTRCVHVCALWKAQRDAATCGTLAGAYKVRGSLAQRAETHLCSPERSHGTGPLVPSLRCSDVAGGM